MATVTVTNVQKDDAGVTTANQVSATQPADSADMRVVSWSIAAVVATTVVMCLLYHFVIKPHAIKIVSSYVPYAGVIAVSAALERFLEPLSQRLMQDNPTQGGNSGQGSKEAASPGSKDAQQAKPAKRMTAKQKAAVSMIKARIAAANPEVKAPEVQDAVDAAAADMAQVQTLRTNRAVLFWAIASICGLALSGGFGLFLLQSIANSPVNPYLDLAVTGLTIGAGTKPTHDLITSLQARSAGSA
jgi:hypothetical protein